MAGGSFNPLCRRFFLELPEGYIYTEPIIFTISHCSQIPNIQSRISIIAFPTWPAIFGINRVNGYLFRPSFVGQP